MVFEENAFEILKFMLVSKNGELWLYGLCISEQRLWNQNMKPIFFWQNEQTI